MFSLNINKALFFLFTLLVHCSFHAQAQDVKLQAGYWQYHQSTSIGGKLAPGRDLIGSECLLEEDSKHAIDYYVGKFQSGLGPESKCTISNLQQQSQKVIFDLQCQSEGGIQSNHQIQYHYSDTKVEVDSQGILDFGGQKLAIQAKNISTRIRACTEEEKQLVSEYKAIYAQAELNTPMAKPLFTISSEHAGPIKEALLFDKSSIQQLFPNYTISKGEIQDNYGLRSAFIVSDKKDKKMVFYIDSRQDSNASFSVTTTSKTVAGPLGERIGVTKLKDIAKISLSKRHLCSLGKNRLARTVVCLDGNFRSLYELSEATLKKYKLGEPIPDIELNQAVLSEMRYFLGYPKSLSSQSPNETNSEIFQLLPHRFHNDIQALKTNKPLIVHFTSTDGSCPHCINNNKKFANFHNRYQDDYTFVEVVFNPWKTYLKQFKRLGGLPATEFYLDNVAIHKVVGYREQLAKELISIDKITQDILEDSYDDVSIKVTDSKFLDQFLKSQASDQVILVNISSEDESCQHCLKHNSFFRYAARQHKNSVVFSEILYNPYKTVEKDKLLKQYLVSNNMKIDGLPVTLVYKNGQIMGLRAGIWPAVSDDLYRLITSN